MITEEITVRNKLGIHARPANKIVKITSHGKSEVFMKFAGQKVNAMSILGVMLLQANQGAVVTVMVDGEDEREIMDAIIKLAEAKFEEE